MSLKVKGLRKFVRACDASDSMLSAFTRAGLLEAAEVVAPDVRNLYGPYSAAGASGVKAKVTKPGRAVVVQTIRKSRNPSRRRGNFGGLMMRIAFIPGLEQNERKVEEIAERLIDRIKAKEWSN